MYNSFLSLNRIINGLSSSLNIASKVIPLYEKGKPMLNNIQKIFKLFNNQNKHIKSIITSNNALMNNKLHRNNPTFFK